MELLLWAERRKLRRSKILWIAGFATVMVALIVFAQGQFTFYESRYIDGAGWFMTAAQSLATFYVLPAVIALLGSYMICREEQEDTLKSLRLIPVDEVKLTLSKMMLALVFSVLIYLLLFAITFLVEAVLHFEVLSIGLVLGNLKTYLLDGIGVFFAISPIIALVARMKKGYWLALVFAEIYSFAGLFASMSSQLKTVYPMTAVFNISGYYDASMVQVFIGIIVLLVCVVSGTVHSERAEQESKIISFTCRTTAKEKKPSSSRQSPCPKFDPTAALNKSRPPFLMPSTKE